jgi:hypothetical protein
MIISRKKIPKNTKFIVSRVFYSSTSPGYPSIAKTKVLSTMDKLMIEVKTQPSQNEMRSFWNL